VDLKVHMRHCLRCL